MKHLCITRANGDFYIYRYDNLLYREYLNHDGTWSKCDENPDEIFYRIKSKSKQRFNSFRYAKSVFKKSVPNGNLQRHF